MPRKEIERCPVPDGRLYGKSNHQTIFMIQKAGGDASIAEIGRRSISAPEDPRQKSPHAILDRGDITRRVPHCPLDQHDTLTIRPCTDTGGHQ